MRRLAALIPIIVATVVFLGVAPAQATGAGTLTMYPGISGPSLMTAGPDGAVWFAGSMVRADGMSDVAGDGVTNFSGVLASPSQSSA